MIIRLSQKLASQLKVVLNSDVPADPNPFGDWSASLFSANGAQYVILTNTASLYSTIMRARGIGNGDLFRESVVNCLRQFMLVDGLAGSYDRFIAPSAGEILFAKALNRSVTGSMTDLVIHAKMWLADGKSCTEASLQLNDIPFSSLSYRKPREEFCSLAPQ